MNPLFVSSVGRGTLTPTIQTLDNKEVTHPYTNVGVRAPRPTRGFFLCK